MKLKKLILSGFKSFADRTTFEFDDGISCVVGPNGCGKSNVVDAVKWALGEQSAKSLRGSEMQDVIFNGSSVRRGSGHAEVTLVFDNSSGLLRTDFSDRKDNKPTPAEVTVTRRLFRNGQSEYLINKTAVRLRDIREMFMDTGMGVNAYGVIEQGQVEVFLQASHDERRAIFDEAAGISRYKAHKKEALRKLDRVEQNMLRLNDVLGEVEKQLRSIKYQAGKARNYQVHSRRLGELKSLHFLSQYHQLSSRRRQLQHKLDDSTDNLTAITTRVDQLNVALSATRVEIEDMEKTARELSVQIATIAGQITTSQERADSNTRRAEELSQQALAITARCEQMEAKIASFESDLTKRNELLSQMRQESENLEAKYDKLHEEYQQREMVIGRLEADLEDEKNGTMDLIRRAAQLHNEVQVSSIRCDNLSGQRDRLTGRAKQIAEAVGQLLAERAQVETKANEIEDALSATKSRLSEAEESKKRLAQDERELQARLAETRERRSAQQSRAEALREMQQRLDGVNAGAKRVLEASRAGRLPCIRGMLGDFLKVDMKHASLIEAALGGGDQQLIAASLDELTAATDELADILGKNATVEIWCPDQLEAWSNDFDAGTCEKVIARAIDRVSFGPDVAPVVWRILGRTLIVETLDDAKTLLASTPRGYRFVTRRGEVLEADGRVRLGGSNRTAGVVARRSELAELEKQSEQIDQLIASIENERQTALGQLEHLDQLTQSLRTAIYEDSMEAASCSERLKQIDEQIADMKREEPIIAGDVKQLSEDIEAAVRDRHENEHKAAELERLNEQRQQQIDKLEEQIASMRNELSAQADEKTTLKVTLGQAREKTQALKDSLSSLASQRDQMSQDLQAMREEIASARQNRINAENAAEQAREEIEQLYSRHEALNKDSEDLEQSRGGLKEKLDRITQQLTEKHKDQKQADEQLNSCRIEMSEVDANVANLISRASDDLGMDLLEQYSNYTHDDQRDWDTVAEEIKDLDGKIKRLGNVNLDAIGEQDELEARRALYVGQIEDIQESHNKLKELIRRLNKQSRELFAKTFDAVRENFQGLFRKLFGGGRADILLTDPENVLESGIEIIARPPGKELRSLSLLSGGEKTMTALALLFSIFKSKPSPFCLLDEVDAALDETNTERFSRLLKEFVESSQFVIISHAKRTMSMANVLYGVTMQEPGVSKRISVRFEDADRALEKDLQPVGA